MHFLSSSRLMFFAYNELDDLIYKTEENSRLTTATPKRDLQICNNEIITSGHLLWCCSLINAVGKHDSFLNGLNAKTETRTAKKLNKWQVAYITKGSISLLNKKIFRFLTHEFYNHQQLFISVHTQE